LIKSENDNFSGSFRAALPRHTLPLLGRTLKKGAAYSRVLAVSRFARYANMYRDSPSTFQTSQGTGYSPLAMFRLLAK
jgi:hypothetical protein